MLTDARTLIAAIASDPADDLAWIAYADWLIQQGDERGAHIHFEREGLPPGGDDADYRDLYLSPELRPYRHYWRFTFERTFIRKAVYRAAPDDQPTVEVMQALLADPHAALLRELQMGCKVELLEALLASPPPLEMLAAVELRNLSARYGPGANRAVVLPRLRELWSCPAALPAILRGDFELPALEELHWFDTQPAHDLFAPGSLLLHPPPKLSRLHVTMRTGQPFAERLVASPLAAQLRYLEVTNISERDRAIFAANRAAFVQLENFNDVIHDWQE